MPAVKVAKPQIKFLQPEKLAAKLLWFPSCSKLHYGLRLLKSEIQKISNHKFTIASLQPRFQPSAFSISAPPSHPPHASACSASSAVNIPSPFSPLPSVRKS